MTPDEVLEKLLEQGIKFTRKTLLNYEIKGVIPKPKRGSGGRGIGRYTDYPPETVQMAVDAYYMFKNPAEYWKNRALVAEKDTSRINYMQSIMDNDSDGSFHMRTENKSNSPFKINLFTVTTQHFYGDTVRSTIDSAITGEYKKYDYYGDKWQETDFYKKELAEEEERLKSFKDKGEHQ